MATHANLPAPVEGIVLTHFLTVRDVVRSRDFYAAVFGGEVVLEENPAIVKIAGSWIIMNPGGGPTPDKPGVSLTAPESGDPVSSFLNVRVADIAAFYADAVSKGAEFLTEPIDREAELRCYLRDPDGYLIEIGQATGMLRGVYAAREATAGDIGTGLARART
ncbi:VOC family protein [Microbacterium sp.]|uniref:VOC family protein n=1 Tax=Microbacterium sp. TaxID=51671 RepID=UPI003F7296C6